MKSIKLTPEQTKGLTREEKEILTKMGLKLPSKLDLTPKFTSSLIKQIVCNECGGVEEQWFLVDKSCPHLPELRPVKHNTFPRSKAKVERSCRRICTRCQNFIPQMSLEETRTRLKNAYSTILELQEFIYTTPVKF